MTRNLTRELTPELSSRQKLSNVIRRIHAAVRLDTIFLALKQDMLDLFQAERMTFYAVSPEQQEIYSRFLDIDTIDEIRLPISPTSVAGYVARTGRLVNITDAYNQAELAGIDAELSFDASWDRMTGFRTRQILAVPITHKATAPIGVIQLLNKKRTERFTREDERNATEIANTLAAAFSSLHRLTKPRPSRFDYLLGQGLLSADDLTAAIVEARRQHIDVESILVDKYGIRKADLGVSLSTFYQCPFVEFSNKIVIPPDLFGSVRAKYLRAHYWVPLARRGKVVDVLIDDPNDLQKVDNVERVFAGSDVRFCVGVRQDILQFIDAAGGDVSSSSPVMSILGELVADPPVEDDEPNGGDDVDVNDSAVVRLAHQLIIDAHKAGASDIHIEPRGATRDTLIRFRVDGSCTEYHRVPPAHRRALVGRLKIMAQLDVAERRKPQDGKITFKMAGRAVELRVATVPTAAGNEDVVMRILASNEAMALENLGMTEGNLGEIQRIASKPYGLILCVGPTGSGKTTSLHAVLGSINKPGRKIWTAEDPVEITQEGLRQVQVQPNIGFTFAAAMRAFLRADPDVIMVGEMRDRETAAIGVEASLTGHLVLSTLHTNSAAETVVRLLDLGVDPFTFADALLGILAQRLVKRLCPACREPYHPDPSEVTELAMGYGEREFEKLVVSNDGTFVLYRARGCCACNRTGYKGRAAIHELLAASDEIKRLIQARAPVSEILAQAKGDGMTTLVQDGILKSLKGVTDVKQVYTVAIK